MTARIPLPVPLHSAPFTLAEGAARSLGRGRMASPDLIRPFRGVRVASASMEHLDAGSALVALCQAFAKRMPDGWYFSHATAAHLWGIPLPRAPDPAAPLDVGAVVPRKGPRGAGVVAHRSTDSALRVEWRHGLPVADIVSVWVQLATVLGLDDLVAAGDHLIRPFDSRPGAAFESYSTPEQLSERLCGFRGRGRPAATQAVDLMRIGAESRRESLLRLAIGRAGLPEPMLNQRIYSSAGRFIGRVDMDYPAWRVVVEYDGEHHRTDDRQYDIDLDRLDGLRRAGRTVVLVRKGHMVSRAAPGAARVARALREAGWAPTPAR